MKNLLFYQTIRDFLLVYLPKQRGCSDNTVVAYRQAIKLFLNYLTIDKKCDLSHISFSDLTYSNVISFLDTMQASNRCGATTRNLRLYALKSFARYTGVIYPEPYSVYLEVSSIPTFKIGKKTVDFISEEAIKSILKQPDSHTKKGVRNMCFMVLMYDTGCRDREMLDLTIGNLSLKDSSPFIKVTGKGNKARLVPITGKTVQHLLKYLNIFHLQPDDNDYLFYTTIHGKRHQMSDDNVARFIRNYGKMAREDNPEVPSHIHPHMFRHARVLHLYRSGMPLPLVSEFLGHASLQSTQIYAYADTEMKRKAIQKARGDSMVPEEVPSWQTDDDLYSKTVWS